MIDVIYDFEDRVKQIEQYLDLILLLENMKDLGDLSSIKGNHLVYGNGKEISFSSILNEKNTLKLEQNLIKTLKSNTILLLYNLIEGTISAVLNEYFGTINRDALKYARYKDGIKEIWIKYKHRSFSVSSKRESSYIVSAIQNVLEEVVEISPKTIVDKQLGNRILYNYDAYIAETQTKDISGNLDARKIRDLFKLYGLPELNMGCDSMVTIKNKRNSLAHGNETFAQVGATLTIQELFTIKDEVKFFLAELLELTNVHLTLKEYTIPEPPTPVQIDNRSWWQKLLDY